MAPASVCIQPVFMRVASSHLGCCPDPSHLLPPVLPYSICLFFQAIIHLLPELLSTKNSTPVLQPHPPRYGHHSGPSYLLATLPPTLSPPFRTTTTKLPIPTPNTKVSFPHFLHAVCLYESPLPPSLGCWCDMATGKKGCFIPNLSRTRWTNNVKTLVVLLMFSQLQRMLCIFLNRSEKSVLCI